ncbi:hypothetical protein [Lacipirellula parvula]|uniref:Uncharacterized protein n=1 Tax=Lacipirellula parvula TaxID=2650471 RepID=A0A5K7XJW8_9BACT|nr:hypothetical protein [Lacipirellula parvula]BBO33189.1 hypothetical protein PLANPX_2801 [Lacipirellula parvula]
MALCIWALAVLLSAAAAAWVWRRLRSIGAPHDPTERRAAWLGIGLAVSVAAFAVSADHVLRIIREGDGRPYIPEQIARLLDEAIESGVLHDEPATELNDWLNAASRGRNRKLERSLVDVCVESPNATLAKVVLDPKYKVTDEDRLKIYRALAHDRRSRIVEGEYGETLEIIPEVELPDYIYEAFLAVADGREVTQAHRLILQHTSLGKSARSNLYPKAPLPEPFRAPEAPPEETAPEETAPEAAPAAPAAPEAPAAFVPIPPAPVADPAA